MPYDRGPEVDGYPIKFFQSNWEPFKEKVCESVQ